MQFRDIKHELEKVFTTIQEATQAAELPSDKDIAQFVRLSRQMLSYAEDQWIEEAEDFLHLANQLQKAVKKGELQDSILIIESLDDARTFCHRNLMK